MEESIWRKLVDEDIELLHDFINQIHKELEKYSGQEAHGYIQPLKHLTFEAVMDLMRMRNKRIDGADDIINRLK